MSPENGTGWTFLSNHAHVLVCLHGNPRARVRDIANAVGITERAVLHLLADLEDEGMIERVREGRRNRYVLHLNSPLRHPLEEHRTVRELLEMIQRSKSRRTARRKTARKRPARS